MTLGEVTRAVLKRWWIVVVCIILGGVGATLWTAKTTRVYQSSVTFFVSTPSSNDAAALAADQFASRRVNSYVRLLSSDALAQAIHDGGVTLPRSAIAHKIHGTADLNTVLLTANVKDTSKARALQIAKLIGSQFGNVVSEVDAQAKSSSDYAVQLHVVSGPAVRAKPVTPRGSLNLFLGLFAGLLIGVAIAIGREASDTSVRSSEDLLSAGNVPVLGSIPYERSARTAPVIIDEGRSAARAESVRKIRTNLQFVNVDSQIKTLAVTSAVAGEGKTSTVLNLALLTAEAGRRVLVIDCDLRNPKISAYTGLPGTVGITDLLAQRATLSDVVHRWSEHDLDIIPCGSIPPNPSELLSVKHMTDLVNSLRADYDLIVLDTPPLGAVTDAAVVAGYVDGVVLVVRYGKTSRAKIKRSLQALDAVDGRVVGTILTMTPPRSSDSYGDYGPYTYTDDKPRFGRRRAKTQSVPRNSGQHRQSTIEEIISTSTTSS
jgi:capsular exopolysaccharide synthesis family protein